jgi:hypothetical protein
MIATSATQHALDRFMTRAKSNLPVASMTKMFNVADFGTPIGHNRFYSRGWIVVVVDGVIRTAYRPRTPEQFNAIFHAKHEAATL